MRNKTITMESKGISKKFGKTLLFRNISFILNQGDSFFITGSNGSGKSTLLQIIAGIQKPTTGCIIYTSEEKVIESSEYRNTYGFTGPQVNSYEMLTATENLMFTASQDVNENKIIKII